MYRLLFWCFAWAGRPFGGIRPRRITFWLVNKAYGGAKPQAADFRWYRDRYGMEFLLHPHYFLDYQVIAFGTYDAEVNNYIERQIRPGMVCLDVGANFGLMSVHLAQKVGPTGRVHCFEPVPHLFQRLRTNVARNRLEGIAHLHQVALSDKSGSIRMAISDEYLSNQGMGSIVNNQNAQLANHLEIAALTLDEFAEKEGLERLDFVKVDIQGAEPLFLQGGQQTLARFQPDLLMEISPEDLAGCGLNSVELLRRIEELGYEIFEIKPSGQVGAQLRSHQVRPDYSSGAVLCRGKKFGQPASSSARLFQESVPGSTGR